MFVAYICIIQTFKLIYFWKTDLEIKRNIKEIKNIKKVSKFIYQVINNLMFDYTKKVKRYDKDRALFIYLHLMQIEILVIAQ